MFFVTYKNMDLLSFNIFTFQNNLPRYNLWRKNHHLYYNNKNSTPTTEDGIVVVIETTIKATTVNLNE